MQMMNDEKYKGYLTDFIVILKKQAKESKLDAENPKRGQEAYQQGHLMAYYSVFSLLKHQASVFNIDEKESGLTDIEPKLDLL